MVRIRVTGKNWGNEMNTALSTEDFTRLHTHLVVPLIVADILSGRETLDEETRYALHDALSEIDPDSALLAIALSAKHIAAELIAHVPVAVGLKFESEKILQEYGPEWLSNYDGGPVDEQALFEMLQTMPEDLEALADLMDSLRCSVIDTQHPVHVLCEILSLQARAHMDVADYILGELDHVLFGETLPAEETRAIAQPVSYTGDNIIVFPGSRTRH